jgi:hypothetical protein
MLASPNEWRPEMISRVQPLGFFGASLKHFVVEAHVRKKEGAK